MPTNPSPARRNSSPEQALLKTSANRRRLPGRQHSRACSQAHYHASGHSRVLRRIREPGVNLCIWTRPTRQAAAAAVQAILTAPRPIKLDLAAPSLGQIEAGIAESCGASDGVAGTGIRRLSKDILSLAGYFAELAQTRHPRVRLTRVEDNCCALFHVDSLRLRMLCTYAGDGTQWLENSNVCRAELGCQGRTIEAATRAIVLDHSSIRTVSAWQVALLKGRGWAGEEHNAIVHRSSPVSDATRNRLVLCIDLPTGCSC